MQRPTAIGSIIDPTDSQTSETFMNSRRWWFATVLVALFACTATADDSKLKVKVGDAFPEVALPGTQLDLLKKDAKKVSIKDLKGKIAVIAFFPKALTGG
jgi:cytochrome oxidase Cu insertion factor (SCO1/SenC/PrrC family)